MRRRIVLIVSFPEDVHGCVVSEWLRKDGLADPVLVDFRDFPLRTRLTFADAAPAVLELPGGVRIHEEEIAGVWWRRPQRFAFAGDIADASLERFCDVNCGQAIHGFFELLGERVVDPPARLAAADLKVAQLRLAERCGLTIPPTCITNDPEAARAFIGRHPSGVVYKIFEGDGTHYEGTRLLGGPELESLGLLRHAPVIFQRWIHPGIDVRVTLVGSEVFAAQLVSDHPDARADIRNDIACRISPYQLPIPVEEGIRRLVAALGLRFACVDLRVEAGGAHYFLEVNPAGQYLFVETATDQPITSALARLLAQPTPVPTPALNGGTRVLES